MGFWVVVMGADLFFHWFQSRNILQDDQNLKRGGEIKKRMKQMSRGESHFVLVSPDPTLKDLLF